MQLSAAHQQKANNRLKIPPFVCPSINQIKYICMINSCESKSAFFCQQKNCQFCSQAHLQCQKNIDFNQIFQLIEKNVDEQTAAVECLLELEKKLIYRIQKQTKALIEQFQYDSIIDQYQKIIITLFSDHELSGQVKSQETKKLMKFLMERTEYNENQLLAALKNYEEETNKMAEKMLQVKTDLLGLFQIKQYSLLNSYIIKDPTSVKFILDALNQPIDLQLLYRASENHFSAYEFHRLCDNVPHTFTLVKTQFEKIIAGYTPLPWKSQKLFNIPAFFPLADDSKKSFLLSVDLKQKMQLIKPEKAICNSSKFGPFFGDPLFPDLLIVDSCNQQYCTSVFPSSYNCQNCYKSSQASCTAFTGALQGNKFKVLEYEVYRVLF